MKKEIRTAFESLREDQAQLENYKMSDKGERQEVQQQLPVIAALTEDENGIERRELVDFIVLNRGYQRENIPQEKARLLKIYSIRLLRQIKQSIEDRVK